MSSISSAFSRDANGVPITTDGITTTKLYTFSTTGANSIPIFTLTGSVEVRGLWGVITTDLANHTVASWRLNDQGTPIYLTAVGGTTLTNKKEGSVIVKKDVVSAALSLLDNANGVVSEPTTLETTYFSPFVLVKKTAAVTQIEYRYSTTDNPTTGTIQFFVKWLPISVDGDLSAV